MYLPQILFQIGYAVCHQIPERTFHLHGQPLPLCSRCTGIYLGAFLIFVFYFFFRYCQGKKITNPPSWPVSIMAMIFVLLMVGNALSQPFGIPTNNLARFITGILFGFSITLFLITAFTFFP